MTKVDCNLQKQLEPKGIHMLEEIDWIIPQVGFSRIGRGKLSFDLKYLSLS